MQVYIIQKESDGIRDLPSDTNITIWDKIISIENVFSSYESAQKYIDNELEIDDFCHYYIYNYEVRD